jgi:hypothetical protein
VLRRLPGKAPKRRNIKIFLRFGNTARQDASAHKNVKLFLREPLGHDLMDNGACPLFSAQVCEPGTSALRWYDGTSMILFFSSLPESVNL